MGWTIRRRDSKKWRSTVGCAAQFLPSSFSVILYRSDQQKSGIRIMTKEDVERCQMLQTEEIEALDVGPSGALMKRQRC